MSAPGVSVREGHRVNSLPSKQHLSTLQRVGGTVSAAAPPASAAPSRPPLRPPRRAGRRVKFNPPRKLHTTVPWEPAARVVPRGL